jgi:hypothetical protein
LYGAFLQPKTVVSGSGRCTAPTLARLETTLSLPAAVIAASVSRRPVVFGVLQAEGAGYGSVELQGDPLAPLRAGLRAGQPEAAAALAALLGEVEASMATGRHPIAPGKGTLELLAEVTKDDDAPAHRVALRLCPAHPGR